MLRLRWRGDCFYRLKIYRRAQDLWGRFRKPFAPYKKSGVYWWSWVSTRATETYAYSWLCHYKKVLIRSKIWIRKPASHPPITIKVTSKRKIKEADGMTEVESPCLFQLEKGVVGRISNRFSVLFGGGNTKSSVNNLGVQHWGRFG